MPFPHVASLMRATVRRCLTSWACEARARMRCGSGIYFTSPRRAGRGSSGGRRFAVAQHEIEVAQIDKDAERLAGDEDGVLAVERIEQKEEAAEDGKYPESQRDDAVAGALRRDPLHPKARREQKLRRDAKRDPPIEPGDEHVGQI